MENNLFVSSFSSREMLLNENIENKLISLINLLLAIYILTLNEKTMNYYINIINLLKNTVIKLIIFFLGILLDPPLAGITAITFISLAIFIIYTCFANCLKH